MLARNKTMSVNFCAAVNSLADARWQHDHFGSDGGAFIELNNVIVDHANAPGRNALADRPRLIRTMNAVEGVLASLPKVECPGAQRVLRSAGHAQNTMQVD